MRRWAFVVSMLGIFVLVLLMNFLSIESVFSFEDLENLKINQKVEIKGKVDEQRVFDDFSILEMNGITVTCDCEHNFLGKNVKIIGLVSEYEGEKQVSVLEIKSGF